MTRPVDGRDRGAAAVEFAVLVPALMLLIGLVIGGGRLAHARLTVQQLADAGARAASIARDAPTARADAAAVITSDAAAAGLRCGAGLGHAVDVAGFFVPVGQPSGVRVEVSCGLTLGDLLVPGLPGDWLIEAGSSSTLDRYRGRR